MTTTTKHNRFQHLVIFPKKESYIQEPGGADVYPSYFHDHEETN